MAWQPWAMASVTVTTTMTIWNPCSLFGENPNPRKKLIFDWATNAVLQAPETTLLVKKLRIIPEKKHFDAVNQLLNQVLCRGHHSFNFNDISEDPIQMYGNDFQVTKTWSNSILVGERWIAFIALYTVPGLELILVTRQCQIYPKLVLSFWVTFIYHLNLSHHYSMK